MRTVVAWIAAIALAGALAASLRHAGLGFAVVQTALHHPIRLAEQMALLDHLLKGRLIVRLGRGSSYNIYDYRGFGIDHLEAQARLDEAEAVFPGEVGRREVPWPAPEFWYEIEKRADADDPE